MTSKRYLRFSIQEPMRGALARAPEGGYARAFQAAYESDQSVRSFMLQVEQSVVALATMGEGDLVAYVLSIHDQHLERIALERWVEIIHHPARSVAVWRAITGGMRDRGEQSEVCREIARYPEAWLDPSLALTIVRRHPVDTLRDLAVRSALPDFSPAALKTCKALFRAECPEVWNRFLAMRGPEYAARLTEQSDLESLCMSTYPEVRALAVQLAGFINSAHHDALD